MINLAEAGTDGLRMTTKYLVERALARNWQVLQYYAGGSYLRMIRPDGKVLELFSSAAPQTSQIAQAHAEDKYMTSLILQEHELPTPETYCVEVTDMAAIEAAAAQLFARGKQVVIKPLDAGHGNGVTVGVAALEAVAEAVRHAEAYADTILIQEYIKAAVDIRMLCIGGKFKAALWRIPARVKGDGLHTISQLIDQTNAQENRGLNYTKELNQIDKKLVARYIGEALQTEVPPANEWYQVLGTANVGTGGETQDMTEAVPQWLIEAAEKAAKVMELPMCGIDFLLSMEPTPQTTQAQLQPVIIELNSCPSLFIHELPTHGQPRRVTDDFLDYLALL